MNGAEQERRDELASLYALGAIDGASYTALREELAATPAFRAELRAMLQVAVGLAQSAPLVEPPAALRGRVLTSVTGKQFGPVAVPSRPGVAPVATKREAAPRAAGAWAGWLVAAASLIIAIGAGAYSVQLRDRIDQTERRAAIAERELVEVRRVLGEAETQTRTLRLQAAVLIAPDMAKVDLAGQPVAPSAAARAFWSRTRGMVFTANALPQLPAGKVYQLWVVPGQAAPISAGLLTPDPQGSVAATFNTPPDIPTPVAIAVTIEPAGGVPQPTGEKYLVGLTGL
jgi:Anti-sigma-K factor rskA, C-terminal